MLQNIQIKIRALSSMLLCSKIFKEDKVKGSENDEIFNKIKNLLCLFKVSPSNVAFPIGLIIKRKFIGLMGLKCMQIHYSVPLLLN